MHSQHALNYKPHLLSLDYIYHGSNNEYLEGIPSLCSKKKFTIIIPQKRMEYPKNS